MAPNANESTTTKTAQPSKMPVWENPEEIVISGISGRFPESDSFDELTKNLFEGVDMITEDDRRWPLGLYGLPTRSGKIKDLSKFDAQFFGVHGKQANLMDPQARLLLELTYEAMVDAGVNPADYRGTRTGVYIGACVSEVEEGLAQDVSKVSGYALTGCSRSMFANRISFTFDLQGPSYSMDTACSSSLLALQQAVLGIRSGQCDQAIVGGVNVCLRPVTALQFNKLSMLSKDGKCKHMDSGANGYVRAEACATIFLQRKSSAKRIYATIVHAKTNTDGYKTEGITFPSSNSQRDLMQSVCQEAGINPHDVSYVEAHGTGTKAGDPQELNAIAAVYATNRADALKVGGVKSNLGHSEPASGLCSLAKVLVAFEHQQIPANLHLNDINTDIKPLVEGVLDPVRVNTPFTGQLAGVNSFGFGGVNVHCVIKRNDKEATADSSKIYDKVPRLVNFAGRTEAGVHHLLDFVEQHPERISREFLALVNDVSKVAPSTGQNHRGYIILKDKADPEDSYVREVTRVPERRPLWFVYSGMGSQWNGMAQALLHVPVFRETIDRLTQHLSPYNVDLLQLLTSEEDGVLDSTVAPFVSIAAVQIGLTNVLRACNIEPDGIVGHSVGELGCAYADGAFDERQMILSAYWRGRCVEQHQVEAGLMAAVGLGWKECQARCPPGVVTACHNSEDSTTISGPYDVTKKFVAELQAEGIFAREVKSCGVAFHSPCVGPIGPSLLEKLRDIIPSKTPRSSKWVSSSIPQGRWNEELAKYSAPEYYVNNLVSSVLFQEALEHVPKNAVLIEIAPHTLLQAILKRSLGSEAVYLGLSKRNNNNANLDYLLQTLGKLYTLGWNPAIENLYPKVQYPVPRGTQSLSSLIKWDHSQSWLVTQYPEYFNPSASSDYVVKVNVAEAEDEYLVGHKIDGRVIYPATGYLMLAWKMLAKVKGQFYDKIPVEFENVTIHRATILPKQGEVKFTIRMMETSGEFSISESGTIVASGRVFTPEEPSPLKLQHIVDEIFAEPLKEDAIELTPGDIYKELRVRGYDYGETFRLIKDAVDNGYRGHVAWTGKWIAFADNLLQLSIVYSSARALMLPVRIQSIRCDPSVITAAAEAADNLLPVAVDRRLNVVVTRGLEIRGLKANIAPRRQGAQNPLLESYQQVLNHNHDISISAADKTALSTYERVVYTLAAQIAEKTALPKPVSEHKPASENDLNKFESPNVNDYPLAYVLREALSSGQPLAQLVTKHEFELAHDPINSVTTLEHFIRPLLDLVAENSPKKMNVVEINESGPIYAPTVRNHLTNTNANVGYTISYPNAEKLTAEQTLNGEAVVNSYRLTSGQALPATNKNADLVVVRVEAGQSAVSAAATLAAATKVGGFALVLSRPDTTPVEKWVNTAVLKKSAPAPVEANWEAKFEAAAREQGLVAIASRGQNDYGRALLFRRRDFAQLQPKEQVVIEVTPTGYEWVEPLKEALATADQLPAGVNVWLVSSGNQRSGVVGLVTCLKNEHNGNRVRSILLPSGPVKVDFTKQPFASVLERDLVSNVFTLDGQLSTYRHLTMMDVDHELTVQTPHAFLNVLTRGDLSSLRWFESPTKHFKPTEDEMLAEVYYAPLNFRDIMLASGKLPPDALPGDLALEECILGLEFAGRSPDGQRLMGMVAAKGLATNVVLNKKTDFLFPVPDTWTLEQAATVPVAYSTAYYALVVRGGLQPGESVLIHSGSGGVGQAAISICLSLGCEVFTTVGSRPKRDFLLAEFPQLSERNLANSRDTTFEQHVLRETGGRGVDLVLNSLSEEKLQASIRCLAQHGRFLEIGKYDLSQNNPVGMGAFLKNIAFHGILLDSLFVSKPRPGQRAATSPSVMAQKQMVEQLMCEGIRTGAVRPLKATTFEHDQAEEAFRFMSTGRHMGKVLLRIRPEEQQKVHKPTAVTLPAISRTEFHPSKSYIIVGGVGGFGLELAEWTITRGARRLVLVSRSGARTPYQKLRVKSLRAQLGAQNVVLSHADVTTRAGCEQLLAESAKLGPVGGIFNLAMVLRDAMLPQQTPEMFEQCASPKVLSSKYLHELTLNAQPPLEHFVVFSSTSCGRGNVGQSNYGFANSTMERIAEERRRAGQSAVAVQWGAIGDVGVVLETLGDNDTNIGGTLPQRIGSCLATLDRFLQSNYPVCSSIVPAEKASAGSGSAKKGLLESIANILGIKSTKGLNAKITLAELGLDSLMGVEVKQTLERDYDVILSLQEIRALSVSQLQEIGSGNATASSADAAAATPAPDAGVNSVSSLISEATLKPITTPYERLNEVVDGKPVFVIPPIEADFATVRPVASLLKRPVYGLNWVAELSKSTSIKQAAAHFIKVAASVPGQSGPLDLVGYSMGAVIAFEMSVQTEVGALVLLDGSPRQMKLMIEKYLTNMNLTDPKEQHVEGLVHFLNHLISVDSGALKQELLALPDEEAMTKRISELIAASGGPQLSVSELQYAATSYSSKMKMMKDYEVDQSRKGDILLLRAEEALIRSEEWAADYGLADMTTGETVVHTFKGNHKSFLTNNVHNIAELINQRL